MRRVLLVFGTRPEAIKLAPVVLALRGHPSLTGITCVTAQHRQMLDQVLAWFKMEPDYDLNLMQPDQTLAQLTARALTGISEVIDLVRPDVILTQGDTTTAMTAALAGFYARIPVGHVEAGLRTYDLLNPYPEEANRRMISALATYHFAPTERARAALLDEHTPPERVFLTGNTVVDALKWTASQPHALNLPVPLDDKRLILVTAHRRESFGAEFEQICRALKQIAERHRDVRLVYPVHLNPNVQAPVRAILSGVERVHLIDPLPYPDLVHLMARATLVLTDSGGIQEEAPSLGKPVLVMRRTTERPEAVEAGTARLVGTETGAIVSAVEELLTSAEAYSAMANAVSPFGDGTAAQQIVRVLEQTFSGHR